MPPTAPSPPTASTPAPGRLHQCRVLRLAPVAGRSQSILQGNTFISEHLRVFRVTTSTSPPARLVSDPGRLENREFSGSQSWDDPDQLRHRFAPFCRANPGLRKYAEKNSDHSAAGWCISSEPPKRAGMVTDRSRRGCSIRIIRVVLGHCATGAIDR